MELTVTRWERTVMGAHSDAAALLVLIVVALHVQLVPWHQPLGEHRQQLGHDQQEAEIANEPQKTNDQTVPPIDRVLGGKELMARPAITRAAKIA